MASTSDGEVDKKTDVKPCGKSRRCSKIDRHPGKCNTERKYHQFWKESVPYIKHSLKRDFKEVTEKMEAEHEAKLARVGEEREQQLIVREAQITQLMDASETSLKAAKEDVDFHEKKVEQLKQEYEKLKVLLQQTNTARSKRAKNPTNWDMINDASNSTRYRRRKESVDILTYIHGGSEAAILGAWDFIASSAPKDVIDKIIGNYKRGKYLEGIFGKAASDFYNSEEALKQAVAIKYRNFLSRRKFKLICKTQSSVFNAEKEVWLPRNIKCLDSKITLPKIASDFKVDTFVKGLDIGEVSVIPNCSGVSRTVTGLLYMILDLYLGSSLLYQQLTWFNDNKDHFVIQFSDDGAPETSELGMSIGSLTCWNFGGKVRSRDCHYLLHCLSVSEKDPVMEDLWKQHTDEMQLLEGNIITIHGHQCTVEFQPSADQSWQSWANNELNQAATYPSPYANVHKGELSKIGQSIGFSQTDTWRPPTAQARELAIDQLSTFRKGLSKSLTPSQVHDKELAFMATNGLRQLGPPRIGLFANRQRPEPVHNEINGWQHLLNLVYKEALRRNVVESFLAILRAPVSSSNNTGCNVVIRGCGLSFVARQIEEHYSDAAHRSNNLSTRLIGRQAISLARYGYRLIEILQKTNESRVEAVSRKALGKAMQYLRNAGTLFNKVETTAAEIVQLKKNLCDYFNVLSLFFPESVNITVWTLGYALPYHAAKLYEEYKIGYGIISLQAKESKHAGVKHDLALSNRSKASNLHGKWSQVMRANYVRAFYLAKHQPAPSSYVSHYESRLPPHIKDVSSCECGRQNVSEDSDCLFCESCDDVLQCVEDGQLTINVLNVLKPVCCPTCNERFADDTLCGLHIKSVHELGSAKSTLNLNFDARKLTMKQLCDELGKRGLSTTGRKEHLIKRLRGALAIEKC